MAPFTYDMLVPLLPELFLAVAGMILLVAGVFRGNQGTTALCWATAGSFALAAVFLLGLEWDGSITLNDMFVLDRFAGFVKLFVLIGLIMTLVMSIRYLHLEQMARFEYPVLVLFAGIGMMIMVSANNLLSLYIGLELQSLCLYVLAAIRRNNVKATEAGIKYFILGALASGMLLFGSSLVYGYTGALDFQTIAASLAATEPGLGLIFGLVFVLAGLAFKVSAVPFHMWTPDVYEGAPTPVTALFAIVPKIAAMALLMRLLFGPFAPVIAEWQQILWLIAAGSMTLGAFAALMQNNVKRLLAYSSIGNMGYALIGVTAGTADGAGAVLVYLILYMIMVAGVFGIVLSMRRGGMAVENIDDLSGLSRTSPLLAYAMAVLMFSMSGIPPLAGFFGKFLIFKAAVDAGFIVLAILGVLTSVVAAYYYLRVIKVMFFDEPVDALDPPVSFAKRAVVFLSVFFVLGFILSPDTLIETSYSAASSLFSG